MKGFQNLFQNGPPVGREIPTLGMVKDVHLALLFKKLEFQVGFTVWVD